MKTLLLAISILLSLVGFSQISVFPYSETFSNAAPPDFTSTSNGWNFTNTLSPRTGPYSASLTVVPNNTKYIYIKLLVQSGYTYSIEFWTKKICSVTVSTNETANQTTLLSTYTSNTYTNNINECNSNIWKESFFTYAPSYTGNMYFQISAPSVSGSEIYIDDIVITETPPVALPISLLYFRGDSYDYYNKLTWSTASETNNDYFVVEKTRDGIDFGQVCKVAGAGNSTAQLFYETYDLFVIDGISYYRLKQVDYNGEETTFDIISIDNRCEKGPVVRRITNIMGQDVKGIEPGMVLIFYYENGTVEKKYFFE